MIIRIPLFALILLPMTSPFINAAAPEPLSEEAMAALHTIPLAPPEKPLGVYYIGHSLVGRNIPAVVKQFAGEKHRYELQLGWGATLKSHWEPDVPVNGFEAENANPRFRDAYEAVDSGDYDAVVLTEMVEIRDAIKYFEPWDYLSRWAKRAWKANPATRVYFYETWHPIDDSEGWLNRIDKDLERYWEREILRRAQAAEDMTGTIRMIPGGQALGRFVREVEKRGGVEGVSGKEDLFHKSEEGEQDNIHLSALGTYLLALTHYAVLYHKSPVGLPTEVYLPDHKKTVSIPPETAKLMQEVVWEVVTTFPKTGVAPKAEKGEEK